MKTGRQTLYRIGLNQIKTHVSSGEGWVSLVCRVVAVVVEELTEDPPAHQEGGGGEDQRGESREDDLLGIIASKYVKQHRDLTKTEERICLKAVPEKL